MTLIHPPEAGAATLEPSALQPDGEPTEVLFPEAKRRERRRRLIVLVTLFAVAGLVAGLVAAFGGAPPSRPSAAADSGDGGRLSAVHPAAARVATADLSQGDQFSAITTVGDRILLSGSTNQSNDTVANTCFSAFVDPSSLVESRERSGSCANPALQGRQVLPVFAVDKDLRMPGGDEAAVVRISHVVANSPGYALGPIVMSFSAFAWGDSEPTWIYGGGDLWLYEWDNPSGVDLMRISATTGEVLQRIRVPQIWKAILAYNDEGLWIAPSGGTSGRPYELYRVTPGSTKATPVFHFSGDGFARWIVGSGDDLWFDSEPRPSVAGTVWMLRGAKATPVWHEPASAKIAPVFETLGESGMVGNGADGLWGAPPTAVDQQQIVRLDPASGRASLETVLRLSTATPPGSDVSRPSLWTGVTLAGSFFLLDPSRFSKPGGANAGSSALYRITPSAER